jgi:two-component system, sensor histidine kinase PdtaS
MTILLLLLVGLDSVAQPDVPDSPRYLLPLLAKTKADTNRIALLNRLGGYYIFKPGNDKRDLDSAMGCLDSALALGESLHSRNMVNQTLLLKGDCYLEADGPKDLVPGGDCFRRVAADYRRRAEVLEEARVWSRYAECLAYHRFAEKALCLSVAVALYNKLPGPYRDEAIQSLEDLANNHLLEGRLDSAEAEFKEAIAQSKSTDPKELQHAYDLLAKLYHISGFPEKFLQCRIECVQTMYASGDTAAAVVFISLLGQAYYILGFEDQAENCFDKVLVHSLADERDTTYYCYTLRNKVTLLAKHGHADQGIKLLNTATSVHLPPLSLVQLLMGYAESYKAMLKFDSSEKYYLAALKIFESDGYMVNAGRKKLATQRLSLADLYFKMGRLDKARRVMEDIGIVPAASLSADGLGQYYYAKFKLDSADGKYISAIRHYTLYKELTDSIYNAVKSRQVQELEIGYETQKKEQSIKDLLNKDKVRQAELTKTQAQKRLTLVGSGLLAVIAVLAFVGLKQKQRRNLILQAHRQQIDSKNLTLESLNQGQALLLREKEWLVREIHHRVKNNLQTTIGLLHMQSSYLTNEQALTAIRSSQHRLQAMSLIHQRLYQSEDMTNVEMSSYITELIVFLKESYRGIDNIYFDLQIDPVELDISLAIPLGLIVNEAITNAIKYAFPDGRPGMVSVSLQVAGGEDYNLRIADNGIGLPAHADQITGKGSLGLDLMRGLTDQVQGNFHIQSQAGTEITVIFNRAVIFMKDFDTKAALM